jgi:hypothetical protein
MEAGKDIELIGKSGERYSGKIYTDNDSTSSLTGRAIVCLSNSLQNENHWSHHVNAIYDTENVNDELARFQNRDDISHLIILPYGSNQSGVVDKVDDLIRSYVHR